MVKTMAKLRMPHASTHGARKPPGPTFKLYVVNGIMMIRTTEEKSLIWAKAFPIIVDYDSNCLLGCTKTKMKNKSYKLSI